MNKEDSTDNRDIHLPEAVLTGLLSLETTSEVADSTDLWMLAKIAGDIVGDWIWEVLYELGCRPRPFDKFGYSFDYAGYNCLYFPASRNSNIFRFSIPKVSSRAILGDNIYDMVNLANTLVTESKFAVIDDEIWLIYEHYRTSDDACIPLIRHILENLRKSMLIFHSLD